MSPRSELLQVRAAIRDVLARGLMEGHISNVFLVDARQRRDKEIGRRLGLKLRTWPLLKVTVVI